MNNLGGDLSTKQMSNKDVGHVFHIRLVNANRPVLNIFNIRANVDLVQRRFTSVIIQTQKLGDQLVQAKHLVFDSKNSPWRRLTTRIRQLPWEDSF